MSEIPESIKRKRIAEFRAVVASRWPHVKVSIKTVHHTDLARASAKHLTVERDRAGEIRAINELARIAGIVPDRNARIVIDIADSAA